MEYCESTLFQNRCCSLTEISPPWMFYACCASICFLAYGYSRLLRVVRSFHIRLFRLTPIFSRTFVVRAMPSLSSISPFHGFSCSKLFDVLRWSRLLITVISTCFLVFMCIFKCSEHVVYAVVFYFYADCKYTKTLLGYSKPASESLQRTWRNGIKVSRNTALLFFLKKGEFASVKDPQRDQRACEGG